MNPMNGRKEKRVGVSEYRSVGVSRQSHRLPYFFLMRTTRPYAHTSSLCRRKGWSISEAQLGRFFGRMVTIGAKK